MSQCSQFDDQLLDLLYEELSEADARAMRAHAEQCPRCEAELGAFGQVRSAARSLPMVEPPSAVTAKLLYQAAEERKRGKVLPLARRIFAGRTQQYVAMAASFTALAALTSVLVVNRQVAPTLEAPPPAPAAAPMAPARAVVMAAETPAPVPSPYAVAEGAPATALPLAEERKVSAAPASSGRGRSGAVQSKAKEGLFALDPRRGEGDVWDGPKDGRAIVKADRGRELAEPKPAPPPGPLAGVAKKESPPAPREESASGLAANRPAPDRAPSGYAGGSVATPPARELPLGKEQNPILARSTLPPPPAKASAAAPSSGGPSSLDDVEAEGRQVTRQEMRNQNSADLQNYMDPQAKRPARPSAPMAPSAVQQQAAQPMAQAGSEPLLEANRLARRFEQQSAGQRACADALATFRELRARFPEQVTARHRLDHARCLRTVGQTTEAQRELLGLRRDNPNLQQQIEKELLGLQTDQVERAAETQRPAPRRKAATKASADKAVPAEAAY